jgi:ribosomal protein S18 acetylase RimI-like enzyme
MNSASSQQSQVVNSGNISYRPAMSADVEAIVTLVNSAYRGPSSRAGWTTEADLLDGQRTDAEEISRLLGMDNSATLLCLCGDEIIGSVHLEKVDSTTAYLGMLVIKPTLQGRGFGGRFMAEAEKIVRTEWGATRIQIQVITLRHELIAYYQRHGYRRTGEIRPFPIFNPKFGLPKVEGLMFEVMEKSFC